MSNALNSELARLNPGQLAAATAENNALVWAGPGTGKTQVAASRAGWLIQTGRCKPHELLVVTFTNRAVKEFRQRLETVLGASLAGQVRVSTFHSLALSLVEMEGQLNGQGRLRLLSSEVRQQLITELVTKFNKNQPIPVAAYQTSAPTQIKALTREVGLLISQFKTWNIFTPQSQVSKSTTNSVRADTKPVGEWLQDEVVWKLARSVYNHYQQHLKVNNLLDLDDLIPGATLTLKNHPKLVRLPGVGVRQILLDETQDSSPQQLALLLGLIEASEKEFSRSATGKAGEGVTQLVAVGDERQQIFNYLHAGGAYDRLKQTLYQPVQMNLDIQYRYGPTINRAATAVSWRLGFEAVTYPARRTDDPQARFAHLLQNLDTATGHLPITVYQAEDEAEEVDFVACEIAKVQNVQPSVSIAVLVRTHRQVELVKQGLNSKDLKYILLGNNNEGAQSSNSTVGNQTNNPSDPVIQGTQVGVISESTRPAPVVISTIHASKGAEFEVVFVTGLAQGLFPANQSRILEDLRLFFVAITRVQYLLYLSYPAAIEERPKPGQQNGQRRWTAPSTFLSILP
jgi:DNA helicase-2/ATP-dependent DNA helicase PcrA